MNLKYEDYEKLDEEERKKAIENLGKVFMALSEEDRILSFVKNIYETGYETYRLTKTFNHLVDVLNEGIKIKI